MTAKEKRIYAQYEKEVKEALERWSDELRKHGRWLPYGEWQVECSECGFVTTALGEGHYCPRCGAKMDEVEE